MHLIDYLQLSEHKIIKQTCESLPKNGAKTLNLITLRDNVLYTWDFVNNCVLSLNIKAAKGRDGDNVIHQKLLPLCPPLFSPESLIANDSGSLVAVAGPSGVLVLELPIRSPPYGAFDNNKEVVYCRSHSLDERLLSCNELVEVRQVKFHPGSIHDCHVLVLLSDNTLRLYQIENKEAVNLGIYSVGEKPAGNFPGTKAPFLDVYGEVAVDFDFGYPEIQEEHSIFPYKATSTEIVTKGVKLINLPKKTDGNKAEINWANLVWPVYILRGDCTIYSINISLNKNVKSVLQGPLPTTMDYIDLDQTDACSLIVLNSSPQVLCVGTSNGTMYHSILLDIEEDHLNEFRENAKTVMEVPSKELLLFETVELELGLSTTDEDNDKKYRCPIFLHKDEAKAGRYFATHSAGVHFINIVCIDDLQDFITDSEDVEATADIFTRPSTAEYLVCTKTVSSPKLNPVVGFSICYEPMSIISLLSDGSLVTLAILSAIILPKSEDNTEVKQDSNVSPLKKMLKEPFDLYIQKILKKAPTQPVLKLASNAVQSQEQSYDLLQRTMQVFREDYFKHHAKGFEEIEKRVHALEMLKKHQWNEVERMNNEKQHLQEFAGNLAEKYEDIKDKQDELLKTCENLLMLVSRKKAKASDAEKDFMKELNDSNEKMMKYSNQMDKVKSKAKYQEIKMANWKAQEGKRVASFGDMQTHTIKNNLQETTLKIVKHMADVSAYKKQLNLQ